MKKVMLSLLALTTFCIVDAETAKIGANEVVEKQVVEVGVKNPNAIHVFVVGDSTLSPFNDPFYYPRYGYGTKIQDYLDPNKVEVVNLALSGRSSKSFITENNYKILVDNIKKGDYLIIGFGHNDEKPETERYTNANGTKEEAGSFKNSLYVNYVKLAQDKGAIPILCTPIVRRSPGKPYEGAVVHITSDVDEYKGGDYPKAIRELAKETKAILVDNTAETKKLYEKLGDDETLYLHAWTGHKPANVDNTHLNTYGASKIAYQVVQAIAKKNKPFKKLVLKKVKEPTKDMLTPNPDYVIPTYAPPTAKSTVFTTTDPWWGTVFGDCGGQEKIPDGESFGIVEGDGIVSMHSGNESKAIGKIAGASDGIAFYFQKLPVDKDFTLTATADVKFIKSNNQVAFGLMLRDDVYIDKFDGSIKSNYVACAPLKLTLGEGQFDSTFARIDGALVETKVGSEALPVEGTKVNLSLTKSGNTVTVQYGNDAPATYTLDLKETDPDNVYVGLFTSRQVVVDFSNIVLQ